MPYFNGMLSKRRNKRRSGGFCCDLPIACAGVPATDEGQRKAKEYVSGFEPVHARWGNFILMSPY